MEHSYYGDQEDNSPELRITMAVNDDEEEPIEQLRSVRSPADIARLGSVHGENYEYESLDPAIFENQKSLFLSLFPNRFASRIKRGKEGGWNETSTYHYLTNEEILEAISGSTGLLRACMADASTRFIAITLEDGSFYKTPDGMSKLRDCLRCVGINQLKLYKYDDSDEWQLVTFFKKSVESQKLVDMLSSWLRRNGIVPGTAGVQLFPNGEPFCLPLQSGFCWINDDGQVIVARDEISIEAALALFVSDINRITVNGQELMARLAQILSKD